MTHYYTLGIERNATDDDIKKAYRKMASQHHPDKGGDTKKFQEVQTAYATLSDPQKRAGYDNPHSPLPPGFHSTHFDFESIFSQFGARPQQQRQQPYRMAIWITLVDSATGGKRTVTFGRQQGIAAVDVEIPLGISDGDNVQYSGIGPGGTDLVINFRIHPNPLWTRTGNNLTMELTIPIWDCILGADTEIRDILGNHMIIVIPPRTQPGTTLRIKDKGMKQRSGLQGDLMIRIQAKIPETISDELIDHITRNRTIDTRTA